MHFSYCTCTLPTTGSSKRDIKKSQQEDTRIDTIVPKGTLKNLQATIQSYLVC